MVAGQRARILTHCAGGKQTAQMTLRRDATKEGICVNCNTAQDSRQPEFSWSPHHRLLAPTRMPVVYISAIVVLIMTGLVVWLLGSPCIELDGRPAALETHKATALPACLAVRQDLASRDHLAALLWGVTPLRDRFSGYPG